MGVAENHIDFDLGYKVNVQINRKPKQQTSMCFKQLINQYREYNNHKHALNKFLSRFSYSSENNCL